MNVEVADLGIACRDPYFQVSECLSDGTLALISYSQRGGQLVLVEPDSHEVQVYDLPFGITSWHVKEAPGPDALLWVGSLGPGSLMGFDRKRREFVDVTKLPEGGPQKPQHVCRMDFDAQRRIYAGTVPTGKLFRYDPRSRELTDLGAMSEANQYVRDVIVGPTGLVFALCGCEACTVVAYDPHDGSKREVTPAPLRVPGVPLFTRVGDIAFADVIYASRIFAYDLRKGEYLYEVPRLGGAARPELRTTAEPDVACVTAGDKTRVFRASTGEELSIPPPPGPLAPRTRSGKIAGQAGVGYFVLDPGTGEKKTYSLPTTGNGQLVVSLFCMSDGTLYGSAELCKTLFRLRPGAETIESLGLACKESPGGQFYGLCELGSRLYMTGYHQVTVSVYDPALPFDLDADNPRMILKAGHQQNRPEGGMIVGPDGNLYIGTQPDYGYKGGALCVFDPEGERVEVHRDLVPSQSVESLATDGRRYVFAGTSTVGGGLVREEGASAHFLAWDCREGRVVYDEALDAEDVRSIAATPDGQRVYVPVGDLVYIFDVPRLRFVGRVKGALPGRVNILSGLSGKDGRVYFCAGSALARVDPETDALDVVHVFPSACAALAQAADGALFTSAGGILYRVRVKEGAP